MLVMLLITAISQASAPLTPVQVQARLLCEPTRLAACEDTNQLIWSKPFVADLTAFVGEGKASWLYPDGNKVDQVIAVLGGPPEVPVKVDGDLLRFSACRHNSCGEKGAVFLTSAGQIKGVAVLHLNCVEDCESDYRMTLIVHERDTKLTALGVAWADEVIAKQHAQSPNLPDTLKSVEIDQVR